MTEGIGSVVIVGGTSGIGRELAKRYAGVGRQVVITGRDPARAAGVAAQLGGKVTSAAFDLTEPRSIAAGLAGIEGPVDHVVLAAIERDTNTVAEFDVDRATRLATLKVVGYVEVIHALRDRFSEDGSVLLFGGQARERPYPGSTTVTTVNGAVTTMVNTLVSELKPLRVNAIHPGIVVDSPYWAGNDAVVENTAKQSPTGRGATMADVVDACAFLLENASVNGVNLRVDCGSR